MRNVQESDQTNRAKRAGQRWANFVIGKGSAVEGPPSLLRSSSNAFLIKLQGDRQERAYEIRMTAMILDTNYEKGVN